MEPVGWLIREERLGRLVHTLYAAVQVTLPDTHIHHARADDIFFRVAANATLPDGTQIVVDCQNVGRKKQEAKNNAAFVLMVKIQKCVLRTMIVQGCQN
jgi:hypothetical protein